MRVVYRIETVYFLAPAGAAASSFLPQAVKAKAANRAAKRTDFFMMKLTKIKD
jgi:hypothetical protein